MNDYSDFTEISVMYWLLKIDWIKLPPHLKACLDYAHQ